MHTAKADRDGSNTVAQRGPDPIRVLPRAVIWLVWAVSGLGVALGVLTFVYGALNHQSLNEILTTVALQAVWAMSFPLVGAVIATHRPRNPLGWMFLFIGLSEGLIIIRLRIRHLCIPDRARRGPGWGAGRLGQPVGLGAGAGAGALLRALVIP
jgi:hypothetical protein